MEDGWRGTRDCSNSSSGGPDTEEGPRSAAVTTPQHAYGVRAAHEHGMPLEWHAIEHDTPV